MKSIVWRARNISLFFIAFIGALFSRSRRFPPQTVRKVVIIQGARLGDMVCTTPLFRALKSKYPDVKITVVGDGVNQKLLAGHPYVDRYVVWRKNFWEVVGLLRHERFDCGIVILPSLESLALLTLSGVCSIVTPHVVKGKSPYETLTYRILARWTKIVPHRSGAYAPREYLRLLEPLGIIADDTRKQLACSDEAKRNVSKMLGAEGIDTACDFVAGILPGVGGDPLKRWAPEKFARLAEHLSRKHRAKIVIIGSGKDRPSVEEMLSAVGKEVKVVNLFDRLTIEEMKACIASLSLFVSADTGPVYVAEAFGIPTIDIVGPVDENVQPPRGEFHRVVVPPRRSKAPLAVVENIPDDMEEARRQAEGTTVEMVIAVADELIEKIQKRRNG